MESVSKRKYECGPDPVDNMTVDPIQADPDPHHCLQMSNVLYFEKAEQSKASLKIINIWYSVLFKNE